MTTRKIIKTLLRPDPGQARAQLEDLASRLAPQDSAAGERLRAVAVELVRRGLEVTVIDYQDASHELEVVLPRGRVASWPGSSGPTSPMRPGSAALRIWWRPCCCSASLLQTEMSGPRSTRPCVFRDFRP
jgi:hypothetical protein